MKLDRTDNAQGKGKYALLNLRKDAVEWGCVGAKDEFFVIKLRDINALPALLAYADSCEVNGDVDFAMEVRELAERSGKNNCFCKVPD